MVSDFCYICGIQKPLLKIIHAHAITIILTCEFFFPLCGLNCGRCIVFELQPVYISLYYIVMENG